MEGIQAVQNKKGLILESCIWAEWEEPGYSSNYSAECDLPPHQKSCNKLEEYGPEMCEQEFWMP